MSTRKLIGKVSATEKNPSSCDEFQFWLSDDTILSPFDIVLVHPLTKSIVEEHQRQPLRFVISQN